MMSERQIVARHVPELSSLTPGRTGNLSARRGSRIAITPSGLAYDAIEPEDVPVIDIDGDVVAGDRTPSSETPLHTAIYDATEADAVVHVHSPWATTFAVRRRPIPPVHYMIALAGGSVPVTDYATFGTGELAAAVVETLTETDRRACLLANHGLVTVGEDVPTAIEVARAVESVAALAGRARAVGEPVSLSEEQIEAAIERFQGYGQDDG